MASFRLGFPHSFVRQSGDDPSLSTDTRPCTSNPLILSDRPTSTDSPIHVSIFHLTSPSLDNESHPPFTLHLTNTPLTIMSSFLPSFSRPPAHALERAAFCIPPVAAGPIFTPLTQRQSMAPRYLTYLRASCTQISSGSILVSLACLHFLLLCCTCFTSHTNLHII